MSTNRALWQDNAGLLGAIRTTPTPPLKDNQLLIKVHAWAVNPCDAMLQDQSLPFITYPVILGQDVAGTVIEAGTTASSKFNTGDSVFGFSLNNGFQEYVVLDNDLAAVFPAGMSFVEAAVFPLAVTTASFALFGKDYLGLPYPSLDLNTKPRINKTVLIWGGSSSVGCNAIQLAKAAGLTVYTTCSPHNFDHVRDLGADKVFDYNFPTVIEDIVAELDNSSESSPCAGIYLAAGSVASACQVSHTSKQRIAVASSNPVLPGDAPDGVDAKMTFGSSKGMKETVVATFEGYLPLALERGVADVFETKGLEGIQGALDLMKKGVSGRKIVVEI
ncbi:chaperonin 10-like protein [Aspergillus californicus]